MAGKTAAEQPDEDKVWVVRFGERDFDPRDLPVGKIHEIAREYATTWFQVVGAPLVEIGVAEAVVRACAEQIGPDAQVPDPLTAKSLVPLFVQVVDDMPKADGKGDPPTTAAT